MAMIRRGPLLCALAGVAPMVQSLHSFTEQNCRCEEEHDSIECDKQDKLLSKLGLTQRPSECESSKLCDQHGREICDEKVGALIAKDPKARALIAKDSTDCRCSELPLASKDAKSQAEKCGELKANVDIFVEGVLAKQGQGLPLPSPLDIFVNINSNGLQPLQCSASGRIELLTNWFAKVQVALTDRCIEVAEKHFSADNVQALGVQDDDLAALVGKELDRDGKIPEHQQLALSQVFPFDGGKPQRSLDKTIPELPSKLAHLHPYFLAAEKAQEIEEYVKNAVPSDTSEKLVALQTVYLAVRLHSEQIGKSQNKALKLAEILREAIEGKAKAKAVTMDLWSNGLALRVPTEMTIMYNGKDAFLNRRLSILLRRSMDKIVAAQ